jgi:hypothetical protein
MVVMAAMVMVERHGGHTWGEKGQEGNQQTNFKMENSGKKGITKIERFSCLSSFSVVSRIAKHQNAQIRRLCIKTLSLSLSLFLLSQFLFLSLKVSFSLCLSLDSVARPARGLAALQPDDLVHDGLQAHAQEDGVRCLDSGNTRGTRKRDGERERERDGERFD